MWSRICFKPILVQSKSLTGLFSKKEKRKKKKEKERLDNDTIYVTYDIPNNFTLGLTYNNINCKLISVLIYILINFLKRGC